MVYLELILMIAILTTQMQTKIIFRTVIYQTCSLYSSLKNLKHLKSVNFYDVSTTVTVVRK